MLNPALLFFIMLKAFANSLKIPEVRTKLLFTLCLILIARVGAQLPLPGVDPTPLQDYFKELSAQGGSSLFGVFNMFTGGAFSKASICALGVMPYISASIIIQLMTAVLPQLSRLQREGEAGRAKINQYTRYLTVLICLVQALLMVISLENPKQMFPSFSPEQYGNIVLNPTWFFTFSSVLLVTAGSLLMMWLGEQITLRGIGNGVSLLIAVNILSDLPAAFQMTVQMFTDVVGAQAKSPFLALVMIVLFMVVLAGVIAITQATRKIPVHYAKRVVGRKVYGGQSSFLPLKVNYAGVMPIIFSSTILMFFDTILRQIGLAIGSNFLTSAAELMRYGKPGYFVTESILIFAFSYFWVSVMFKPIQIADDLKKHGGYIPSVRPGEPTAKFLDHVMTRLTLAGAIFLTLLAVIPGVLSESLEIPQKVAQFFGGTGILIVVGVALDTLRQVETHLIQRNYEGFLKKGRIQGRGPLAAETSYDPSEFTHLRKLSIVLFSAIVIGLILSLIRLF